MPAMSWIFVLGLAFTVVVCCVIAATRPFATMSSQRVLGRLTAIRDTARIELGSYGGAVAVLLATAAAAVIVSWPFGRFARRYEPNIDRPFLRWTQRHVSSHGWWHTLNAKLTLMGNRPEIKLICIAAAVGFGIAWAVQRRAWWVPTLVMAATFGFEKFGQMALRAVVDRHTVALPAFGSFPSGGCARLITVYGMVLWLAFATWPTIGRRWRVTGWTVLTVLAFIEGYTRVYLIKHWGMDVVGGWLYGGLMLLALIAAASCLIADSRLPDQRSAQPDQRQRLASTAR